MITDREGCQGLGDIDSLKTHNSDHTDIFSTTEEVAESQPIILQIIGGRMRIQVQYV